MKELITSDLHLTDNQRDAYRFHLFDWLIKIIDTRGIDRVCILGDLTDAKNYHSAELTNRVTDCIAGLAAKAKRVDILRGNHDGTDPAMPFFKFLGEIPNVRFFSEPTLVRGDAFIPHTTDVRDFKAVRAKRAFTHCTFKTAISESGQVMEGLPLSSVSQYVRVFSGDVHVPQNVGNVTYVGAPYTIRFGDRFKPRVLILDGNTQISVDVPGPRKVSIDIKPGDALPDITRGDIIQANVHLRMTDVQQWSVIRNELHDELDKLGVVVHAIRPIVNYVVKNKQALSSHVDVSDDKLVRDYAYRHGLDDGFVRTGLKLLEDK